MWGCCIVGTASGGLRATHELCTPQHSTPHTACIASAARMASAASSAQCGSLAVQGVAMSGIRPVPTEVPGGGARGAKGCWCGAMGIWGAMKGLWGAMGRAGVVSRSALHPLCGPPMRPPRCGAPAPLYGCLYGGPLPPCMVHPSQLYCAPLPPV